jgi:hypothetical protein
MQTFFFIAFPYIALILAIGVGLYRYFVGNHLKTQFSEFLP